MCELAPDDLRLPAFRADRTVVQGVGGGALRLANLVAAEQQADEEADEARREFRAFLADFRESVVLVPLDERDGLWSARLGGIRWLLAFSDEPALARFAWARDAQEGTARPWNYRKVLGSWLLDSVVPALGVPCGVALDAGSAGGRVLPPVPGIVPDRATVDAYTETGETA